jgi:putative Holliday junction resolvase
MLDAPALRLVAVDYGTKRVGIALADPLRMFAQPHGTFTQRGAVEELQRLHAEDGLETIVIGWPLTLQGEEGRATERVQQYINRLRNALPGDVQVVKRDERFTSEMAKDTIRRFGEKRAGHPKDDKGRVDAAAAALILQDYLDTAGGG